jgi:hypothetical protein
MSTHAAISTVAFAKSAGNSACAIRIGHDLASRRLGAIAGIVLRTPVKPVCSIRDLGNPAAIDFPIGLHSRSSRSYSSCLPVKQFADPKSSFAIRYDGVMSGPGSNRLGLPDELKAAIESASGISPDSARVHYDSTKPKELNELACARDSAIHVAPGLEQHLPHEAWHVVRQAQGRVTPTMQMTDGAPLNDDAGLEREADATGTKRVDGC